MLSIFCEYLEMMSYFRYAIRFSGFSRFFVRKKPGNLAIMLKYMAWWRHWPVINCSIMGVHGFMGISSFCLTNCIFVKIGKIALQIGSQLLTEYRQHWNLGPGGETIALLEWGHALQQSGITWIIGKYMKRTIFEKCILTKSHLRVMIWKKIQHQVKSPIVWTFLA